MTLPQHVNTALAMLEAAGFEAFLVGGAVRDYVRGGSPAADWDIATNALPQQVKGVFAGFRLSESGLKHGTVAVLMDPGPLEITTYRIDGAYSDHRHPDTVRFTRELREDLKRRDFTMNALAYHPRTGVVDFTGGLEDISNGLVRCVGDPDRRFREDGLRILRALRFASAFGMNAGTLPHLFTACGTMSSMACAVTASSRFFMPSCSDATCAGDLPCSGRSPIWPQNTCEAWLSASLTSCDDAVQSSST